MHLFGSAAYVCLNSLKNSKKRKAQFKMQQERAKGELGSIATAVATYFQNSSIRKPVSLKGE